MTFCLGRRDRFESMVQLLGADWRDVLMAGGVGHDDWPAVLDRELGVSSGPGLLVLDEGTPA